MSKPRAPDLCSELGAARLAAKLQAWWHAQGEHEVRFWIERSNHKRVYVRKDGHTKDVHADAIWLIRSNLVRGLPPSKTDEPAGK